MRHGIPEGGAKKAFSLYLSVLLGSLLIWVLPLAVAKGSGLEASGASLRNRL
tara:strand:+ start:367 stop:522 length:156 start_codon:yes stop_codon:yes gene_type:complete